MTPTPHERALELRQQLIDLHESGTAALPAAARAEAALWAVLRAHRDTLGRSDFWRGYYSEMDGETK